MTEVEGIKCSIKTILQFFSKCIPLLWNNASVSFWDRHTDKLCWHHLK